MSTPPCRPASSGRWATPCPTRPRTWSRVLRAAIATSRPGARIVLVGSLDRQLAPDASGAAMVAPVEVDTFAVILRHITLQGLDNTIEDGWAEQLDAWCRRAPPHRAERRDRPADEAPRQPGGPYLLRY